jgi:hypothetical protein
MGQLMSGQEEEDQPHRLAAGRRQKTTTSRFVFHNVMSHITHRIEEE